MILAVYKHLVDQPKPGIEFHKFVKIVHQISPFDPELQKVDQKAFGRLGVALMHACSVKLNYLEGYKVLYVLHKHGIKYATCGEGFGMDVPTRNSSRIAITASSICLNLNPPKVSGALEVLQGCNYALPCEKNDKLTSLEQSDRADLLNRLIHLLMIDKQFDKVYDLLSRTDCASGLPDGARDFLNELLSQYSQNVDEVHILMEKLQFSREPKEIYNTENEMTEAVLQTEENVIEVLTENLNPAPAYLDGNPAQEVMNVKTSFI